MSSLPVRDCCFLLALTLAAPAPAATDAGYVWHNVAIGGGGFVTGIEFHPGERNLIYARTDVGGAYRWDAATSQWVPLVDWIGRKDWNLHGIESLAVDPTDPDRLYLAAGTYTFAEAPAGEILRSNDRGRTWARTVLPFKLGANEAGRGSGERLVVDPARPARLYLGTRRDGLWRSDDHGATWARLPQFPDVPDDSAGHAASRGSGFNYLAQAVGIIWVKLAPETGDSSSGTRRIFAAVSTARGGLYASADGGETWSQVEGQPRGLRPTGGDLGPDGRLWITYADEPGPNAMRHGAVWTFDLATGRWTECTPEPATLRSHPGYAAVSVDPADPDRVVVSTWMRGGTGEEVFRSIDGGRSWRGLLAGATWDHASAPYSETMQPHWISDVEIDPFNPGAVLFNTGYGLWRTVDVRDFDRGGTVRWVFFNRNLEETVPLVLVSPPEGPHLLSGLGDVDGFVHQDFRVSPAAGRFPGPRLKNTEWMDYAGLAPQTLVRSGTTYLFDRIHAAVTTDSGATWTALLQEPPHAPRDKQAHPIGPVGLSADGRTISWTLLGEVPHFTEDRGATWRAAAGAPAGLWAIGDRVDPATFSGYDPRKGDFYISRDRGRSFHRMQTGLRVIPERSWGFSFAESEAVPGHAGEVWVAAGGQLYHFSDYGQRVRSFEHLREVGSVGLGAPAPGAAYPAVFVVAKVTGVDGLFRSDDTGETWTRITDASSGYGSARGLTGDPRVFGRVYLCTGGRGIIYGEPRAAEVTADGD